MKRILKIIIFLTATFLLIFAFRSPPKNLFSRLEGINSEIGNIPAQIERVSLHLTNQYLPCSKPITYRIGSFDARFGISRDDFLAAISQAAHTWGKPVGRNLFTYAPDGNLKINLIYDSRQDATIKLRAYGLIIHDDQASYDALKIKYQTLEADYMNEKTLFDAKVTAFQNRQNTYNQEVAYWNGRGGAPQETYDRLNTEKDALNAQLAAIDRMKNELNAKVDEINAMVVVLNRLAAALNIEATQYNTIGSQSSGEFEEGLYQSDASGQKIDIYQFDDSAKLVRVLAHELGHALGLDHLANPKAIMYRLNQGANEKLTADDLAALKKHCGIQ